MRRLKRFLGVVFLLVAALVMGALNTHPACAQSSGGTSVQRFRLAMVELRNPAGLRDEEVMYLTDQARTQASVVLPGERFLVMTRESIVALLPPGKTLADCAKGQCEVEVGRTIGADYIVTGEVLRFGDELRLTLKVHACQSGEFLGSATDKGFKVNDLESGLADACGKLFALVRTHAGVASSVGSGNGGGNEGRIGTAPPPWDPNAAKKLLVKFTSDPPGAVVRVDGQLLCQGTPCSKLLPPGTVQIQMERERYAPRIEAVTIPSSGPGAAVSWSLMPTFGWLTVRTTPDSLAISVNGEVVGRSPVVKRDVAPGTFEVRVADERFYESGERVVVATGAERTVTLVPTPREGAIEVTAMDAQGNDVAGKVSVDGKAVGDAPGTYKLIVGKHRVVVLGATGGWKGDVTVAERQIASVVAKLVKGTDLEAARYDLLADGEIVRRGDLMWTVRDNGSAVDWYGAKAYCETCRVGGYGDWRLPTLTELMGLYDARSKSAVSVVMTDTEEQFQAMIGDVFRYDVHIAEPFVLSAPWQWSSTLDYDSQPVPFDFHSGSKYGVILPYRRSIRVLCVRRSGE